MRLLARCAALWRNLVDRDRVEADLDDEVEAALELLVHEKLRAGLDPTAAHRAARLELGGVEPVKARVRDVRAGALLDAFRQDLRYAARGLARNPGFTFTAAIALALGLGVNGMFLTVVNAHTMRGLRIDEVDRVLYVTTRAAQDRSRGLSCGDFQDLRAASRSFEALAAFTVTPVAVGDDDRASERAAGVYVSPEVFGILRGHPLVGRIPDGEDDRPGAPPVVLLGHGIWNERYGASSAVIGRAIKINGTPTTVIGVMPDAFDDTFPVTADLWLPLPSVPGIASQSRGVRPLAVIGRLGDGVTIEQARSELSALAARLSREYPGTNDGIQFSSVRINERYLGRATDPAWMSFVTAGVLIVLISCANVANLLMMRLARRSREIAIRASLGASRRRIVGQLLVESLLLAVGGAAIGWALSSGGLRLFAAAIPSGALPPWLRYELDARVFGLLTAACLGSVLVFGLAPALHASRTDGSSALKNDGRLSGRLSRSRRWTAAFLMLQLALTIVLVANVVLAERQTLAQSRETVV